MKKKFILDTNVILHDSGCIHQFKDNHVFIPITVIEELDKFKKGNDVINCNARDFLRTLDALSGDMILNGGAQIDSGEGKISILLEVPLDEKIRENFNVVTPDVRILNIAYTLAKKHDFTNVVFVTKDVNLRLRARSIGLKTENYNSKYVENLSDMYTGIKTLDPVDENILDEFYQKPGEIHISRLNIKDKLFSNENFIIKNGSKSALGIFDEAGQSLKRIQPRICYGIKPRNSEQTFALNAMLNPDIPLVTLSGKAGTGKTLLALAAALENKHLYRQIFVARPVVPLSNKDIGFLPGDVASKLDPYMQPLYDNLSVIQNHFNENNANSKQIRQLLEEEKIVITPISYIRGRSIVKVFFIVDEAQNLTPHEVKTIITRAGEGTKIVFTGDIFQIDHPYLDSQTNGLAFIIEKMKGQRVYAHINLEKGERSELAELAAKIL
ncbi:MAG: phosphate starvation-inducible protein PhoH [Desulfobacula sp. RIFOXYA12_FULL_46_16]|nr:MAG: phosphate starvation-inducible protein PhoH [Deltaproteobacteria bacterium RIFOXYC2_FULL_48_10]OGR20232.1 MAG: phosphate starvation-inducible protein PhoH [Desulfobacula sp. RIFOXYA12_FULL_46_16]OGR39431.1 MAG: phosphate starvation-inducible protein PhoH [Desulfobacula sp. RIFOXYB2_FULL_45_6]